MQDRVADVLAQRAALDNGYISGVILSILLHGSLTAAAVYAARNTEAPRMASVLNIRLASPAAPTPAVVQPSVQPAAPPVPVTPRIEPPKPEPVKPVETAVTPQKNTVPLSPFGRSTKKGSENPAARPPAPSAAAAGVPGGPATGVMALEGGDFPYTLYIERMTTLIGSRFFRPQAAVEPVVIYFVIERDGTLRDARTETPSGNPTFDRAALRAVLESSPLPPLPFGYSGTYLGVHLKFQ